jgi:hypothetical protein
MRMAKLEILAAGNGQGNLNLHRLPADAARRELQPRFNYGGDGKENGLAEAAAKGPVTTRNHLHGERLARAAPKPRTYTFRSSNNGTTKLGFERCRNGRTKGDRANQCSLGCLPSTLYGSYFRAFRHPED